MRRCRGMRAAVTNGPKPYCPALASTLSCASTRSTLPHRLVSTAQHQRVLPGVSRGIVANQTPLALFGAGPGLERPDRPSSSSYGTSRSVRATQCDSNHSRYACLSPFKPPPTCARCGRRRVALGAQLRVFPIGVVLLQPQPVVRKHGRMLRARRRCLISASPPPAARAQQSTAV